MSPALKAPGSAILGGEGRGLHIQDITAPPSPMKTREPQQGDQSIPGLFTCPCRHEAGLQSRLAQVLKVYDVTASSNKYEQSTTEGAL